jgi:hypothetical protein
MFYTSRVSTGMELNRWQRRCFSVGHNAFPPEHCWEQLASGTIASPLPGHGTAAYQNISCDVTDGVKNEPVSLPKSTI